MENKVNLTDIIFSDEADVFRPVIIAGIFLVYITTIFSQIPFKISIDTLIIFTILMIAHLLLHLFFNSIFHQNYWLYFIMQGIIIFSCAFVMSNEYQAILLGLIPILSCQGIVLYYGTFKVIISSIFSYSIFFGTIILLHGWKELIHSIPILLFISIAVLTYSFIIIKQVRLRIHTQKVLKELEYAYEKVEELTLTNERQRISRDLHDTLSQGLAGSIMQLEAISANLNLNNIKRAQEIVQTAMEHARNTLSNSRLVISDLRFQENVDLDFVKALEVEITDFKSISNTSIAVNIDIKSQLPVKTFKHILYIVREALNNIVKHAKANTAVIEIIETDKQISITIADDGIGFNVKILDQLFGHYGILGMTERVKALQGKMKIISQKKSGTNLTINIPIGKGITDENA